MTGRLRVAVVAVLCAQLGFVCSAPEPNDPRFRVEVVSSYSDIMPSNPAAYLVLFGVTAESTNDLRAVDLDLSWKGDSVAAAWPVLGPEFDDDGQWFGQPGVDIEGRQVRDLVDLRHGPEAATGGAEVARLWLFVPDGTGVEVTARGKVGLVDGTTPQAGSGSISFQP